MFGGMIEERIRGNCYRVFASIILQHKLIDYHCQNFHPEFHQGTSMTFSWVVHWMPQDAVPENVADADVYCCCVHELREIREWEKKESSSFIKNLPEAFLLGSGVAINEWTWYMLIKTLEVPGSTTSWFHLVIPGMTCLLLMSKRSCYLWMCVNYKEYQ